MRLSRARSQALGGAVRESSAVAVVRRVFAIQAQDAVAADPGIRARADGIGPEEIRRAYEDERGIVRTWLMRGTLHTVPSEDPRVGPGAARTPADGGRRSSIPRAGPR
ncbi:DNA glycosylase AlkZ-like family protein [Streptomyces albipurpureus]|uniref:Winged helix DNA-binding domain-containing protein n=1 Tax=Streptomyces albipurpureus TaxID=2897419 RepID=A0ABT0UKD1_9ACTN|nr:crosslink repair DNA glycosylase YcaQ family protein [Streptomyces sp. CWNU-1]MCM2389092.1 winged helix DNA-binding domain-containing protein [Streptomyces sp. CWNU-1]